MTTEIKLVTHSDAFSDNEVLVLDRAAYGEQSQLMVAEWTAAGPSTMACLQKVLAFVYEWFDRRLDNYDFWLLVGHSSWQSDTRIVRYRKIFNSLAASGINFEGIAERAEAMVESEGKVKFFGAVRLNESVLSLVPETMPVRSSTYLALIPKGGETSFPLSTGWSGQWSEDSLLIKTISDLEGVVFQRTGFFDDPEAGLIAVGSPHVLGRVLV